MNVKLNKRVIAIVSGVLLLNIVLVMNYYSNNDFVAASSAKLEHTDLIIEEHFRSVDKSFESYTMKYTPNYVAKYINDLESTLVMSLIAPNAPYGKDRVFDDFFQDVLLGLEMDYKKLSLAIMCIDKAEYETIRTRLRQFLADSKVEDSKKFNKITLLYAPFLEENGTNDRNNRQLPSFQRKRRSLIAKSRNFLINKSLQYEQNVLTFDSDIISIDKNTLRLFIDSKKEVVVPRIVRGDQKDYDLNSWKGARKKPSPEEMAQIEQAQKDEMDGKQTTDSYAFVPMDVEGHMKHLVDMSQDLKKSGKKSVSELVEVDSVGGAVLFVKAQLFSLGIQFPMFYLVGASWDLPLGGYDGIETEGLCYVARTVGYTCWAMPNLVAHHSIE